MALPAARQGDDEREAALSRALDAVRSRVSAFTLANGMRWVVMERRAAPIVACHVYAAVGAADEPDGQTGLAHFLEHLAFKGTSQIGSKDPKAEASVLDELDYLFYQLREAKESGKSGAASRLAEQFEARKAQAAELSVPNAYGALLSREGGVGLNAQTTQDSTEYFVSLPANKLELWMALESARFIAPVFRDLYAEKEVVKEERRLRVDNAPLGRFLQSFSRMAFPNSPYGRPVIGYPEDFEKIGRREVEAFFWQRYTPKALTCWGRGSCGGEPASRYATLIEVYPALSVERLARRYFGGWLPAIGYLTAPPPPPRQWRTSAEWEQLPEPTSDTVGQLRMSLPSNPFYIQGHYRPAASSTDDPTISVISELLSSGRTSRLYKRLVLQRKALAADAGESYPGDLRPNLLLLSAIPLPGGSTDELAVLLQRELEDLAQGLVDEDQLVPVRKATRAGLLEIFGSNSGMANLLCKYEAEAGGWDNLLRECRSVEEVTPEDVRRVASLLTRPGYRVSGHVQMTAATAS
eukprot:SM000014S00332  [mRNA]  locus=s14:767009:771792:- [translate_table: standard]